MASPAFLRVLVARMNLRIFRFSVRGRVLTEGMNSPGTKESMRAFEAE